MKKIPIALIIPVLLFETASTKSYAQNLPSLSSLIPTTPQAYDFRQVGDVIKMNSSRQQTSYSIPQPLMPSTAPNGIEQYERDLQQVMAREQQEKTLQNNLKQEEFYRKYLERLEATKYYRGAFAAFSRMNPDSFSLSKAIYLAETAYQDNKIPYDQFLRGIQSRAELVRQILKREHLSISNNLALNYGIQKLFSQANSYYDQRTKRTILVPSIKYDFEDFRGDKDYSKMFVSKLMMTGKGQCHSMPLLYLALAEQLGAKAYLSLAPQHSFIQFFDDQNNRWTFETTSGNLVSQNWIMQSGFVNAAALKNKTYVDTLSQHRLYAQCMADLLLGYEKKFGYDDFAEQIRQKILSVDPSNLAAKITDANLKTQEALAQIKVAGSPSFKDLPNYPQAYAAYQAMQESYKQIDNLGYQDMPAAAYQAWRASIEKEKNKQQTKEVKERMQQEIKMLRDLKTKIILLPRG